MDQVFVINPKGGCGKTTISTQLAGFYANRGKTVLLADHDAQKSSSDWLASRPSECAGISVKALSPKQSLDCQGADLVIHDMPAAYTLNHVDKVIRTGDRMLIPVLASPTDIKACLRFVMGLYRDGLMDEDVQVGMVANKVRSNTKYAAVLRAFLSKLDIAFVGQLRDTQNYIRLMDCGMSVFDVPKSRVQRDLEDWSKILSWLALH